MYTFESLKFICSMNKVLAKSLNIKIATCMIHKLRWVHAQIASTFTFLATDTVQYNNYHKIQTVEEHVWDLKLKNVTCHLGNVRGEPVSSVMAAGWFCEKSGWIGKVEDVKPVLLKNKRFSSGNRLRRIFTWMNCEIGGFHLVWFI